MPRQRVVRIYVQPYVRKFLLHKFGDPVRLAMDPGAQDLLKQINDDIASTKRLARRIVGVENDQRPGETNRAYVDLWLCATKGKVVKLSARQHRSMVAILSKQYFRQLYQVLDWCRGHQDAVRNRRAAITMWMERLSITDEEHALDSIERLYRKRLKGLRDEGHSFLLNDDQPQEIRRSGKRPLQLVLFRDL